MWGEQSCFYSWRFLLLLPFSQPTSQSNNLLVDCGKIKGGSASCYLHSIEGFETVNDAVIQSV